jgi:glycosyltransferase involved in cell wall biosynthesis
VADLFLMPSETESFGLAALEAMACQVPVISSNTGGLPELNVDGVTGFLSNVGDVDEMVRNAIYILQPENLPRFKEAALARALEFDITNIRPLYERYYEKVLERQMLEKAVLEA